MELRQLETKEMQYIYNTYMKTDFPADELKPLSAMVNMMERGHYRPYGLYEGEELRGYAYLVLTKEQGVALIDYLAVLSQYRGGGYGSRLIEELRNAHACWQGLILEVENPEYAADEAELAMQKRRIHFYQKNGVELSELKVKIYGVPYQIMYLAGMDVNGASLRGHLETIYHTMFPEKVYVRHVEF